MNREKLIKDLKREEGVVLHAYNDHLGFTTIGVGRLIDKRRGGGISISEAEYLLGNDIYLAERELDVNLIFYKRLDETRQRALCNMCFQLGIGGLLKFRKMLVAIAAEDWPEAYNQALDSVWATQTPARAMRVASMLLKGDDYV
ncbi:MAG: glycoside hydrolase family protein [Methylococcaceae bacterium]